jgi:hypothetical protein
MVNISIQYTGDLHCDAVHGASHAKISTPQRALLENAALTELRTGKVTAATE